MTRQKKIRYIEAFVFLKTRHVRQDHSVWMPRLIRDFTDQFPDVRIELTNGSYRDIEEKISSGKLDCGFLSAIEDDPLDFLPLLEDEILAIMPQRRTIGLATLPPKETTLLVRTFTAFCKSYSF